MGICDTFIHCVLWQVAVILTWSPILFTSGFYKDLDY